MSWQTGLEDVLGEIRIEPNGVSPSVERGVRALFRVAVTLRRTAKALEVMAGALEERAVYLNLSDAVSVAAIGRETVLAVAQQLVLLGLAGKAAGLVALVQREDR